MLDTTKRWQLVTDNGGAFRKPSATLFTTEMLTLDGFDFGYRYESCIFFSNHESEVLNRYDSQIDAFAGHIRLCNKHQLNRKIK